LFDLTSSTTPSSAYHDDNNNGNNYASGIKKTKVLQGPEKVIDISLQFTSNAENKIDAFVDHTRPSLILELKELKKASMMLEKEV
jgi:hypothetical protein